MFLSRGDRDLPEVQGTLKSLLQHHSSKALIQHSAFFMVQLSHPYMTTGKTVTLTIQTFVGKVISLFFKYAVEVCHRFSSKEQVSYNSWLKSPSAVILEPREIKSIIASRTGCHDLSFLNVEF